MLTKQEIERFLEHVRLYAPDHVFMTDTLIADVEKNRLLSGLGGRINGGVVFLTPADGERVFAHELIHVQGFGELLAYGLDDILLRIEKFREAVGRKLREVKYSECSGCVLCNGLSKMAGKRLIHLTKA